MWKKTDLSNDRLVGGVSKYEELQQRAQRAGYRTTLITLEVGSRGIIHFPGFCKLKNELKLSDRDLSAMLQYIVTETITQSHSIWSQRNHLPT